VTTLRWIAVAAGCLGLIWSFREFRHHRVARFDFGLAVCVCSSLMLVGFFPDVTTLLRDLLALEKTAFSRLLALTIVSNLLLWFLVIYQRGKANRHEHQFDRLIRHTIGQNYLQIYPPEPNPAPIAVVIPAFNEAENLEAVLGSIAPTVSGEKVTVLVVDDGSDDSTLQVARQCGAHAVAMPVRRGGGAAIRTGFDLARLSGARIAVTMDGDGQHLGEDIPKLVEPILRDEADLVIGSRILGHRERDSRIRLAGIHVFNALIRLLTPVAITDCSNGFRAIRLEALAQLDLRQNQYHTAELIIEANRKGLRLKEVGITVKKRLSGESKKGRNWRYGFRFLVTIIKTWWR